MSVCAAKTADGRQCPTGPSYESRDGRRWCHVHADRGACRWLSREERRMLPKPKQHMTRPHQPLGNLLAGHHAGRAIAQRERLEMERERREAAEARVTIVSTRPGCEPDSMWIEWADGSESYCGNWSRRPKWWPEGGA